MVAKATNTYTCPTTPRNLDDFAALSLDCFWEMDTEFQYTYVSSRFSELTGIPRTIAIGMTNEDLGLTIPDRTEKYAHQKRLKDGKAFRNSEFVYVHPNGRELILSANGDATYDPLGAFSGYRGTTRQIERRSGLSEVATGPQSFYQLAGRVANLGFWEWDEVADKCAFCSEELARIHGLTVEEFLSDTVTNADDRRWIHRDDRERYETAVRAFREDRVGFEIEYRLVRADRRVADVVEVVAPIVDDNGILIRTFGFVKDITETKQAAKTVEEISKMHRQTASLAMIGHWEWDELADKCLNCSEEMARLLGLTVGEYLAHAVTPEGDHAFVHPADRRAYIEFETEYMLNPARVEIEYRLLAGEGKVRDVREMFEPIFDDSNRHVRSVGFIQDISASKQAAASLEQARNELEERVEQRSQELLLVEERLHELGENAREVLYVLTADWQQVLYVNKAFERIWGYSCEAVVENPGLWIDSLHPDDRKMIVDEIHEKWGSKVWDPNFSDCRIIGKNGEVHWLSTRIYPIRDRNGEIVRVAGVVEDITERKEATDALHQVQKMDAVGQLTSGVAHDFNNLLAVILGNARLLEGRVSPDDEELLRDIIAAGDRGAELTMRLLAFSRLQPLQPKPTDVTRLISDLGGLLQRTLGSTISVEISSICAVAIALVDPGLLENALLNLSINARDAMPRGGRLIIRVEDSDPLALVPPKKEGANLTRALQVVVQDNGIGMSEEVSSRSLEPFFTTKAPGEGSGLGLSMVYGFVKQSNGDLLVDSKPDIGTVVTIRLPCLESNCELPD